MIALSVFKIYANALHWLMVEVLPKIGFWGINGGGRLTLKT